jgi:hypothetical protein
MPIESPKKAFMRDWYKHVIEIEEHLADAASRKLADHVAKIREKDTRTGAHAKRRQ